MTLGAPARPDNGRGGRRRDGEGPALLRRAFASAGLRVKPASVSRNRVRKPRRECLFGVLAEVVRAAGVFRVAGFDVGGGHAGNHCGELLDGVQLAGLGAAGLDGARV